MQLTVSPKYQIAIPKKVRETIHLKAGQKLDLVIVGDTIRLIPVRSMKEMFGKFPNIKKNIEREDDRAI